MTHLILPASATLLVIAVLGAWLDIREVKIPAWLSIAGVILGAGLNFSLFGVHGLILALAGLGATAVTYAALHLLRIADFGRFKLMAPVGAIVGPTNWLLICVFSVILGVPVAIFTAFSTAQLQQTGAIKGTIVREFLHFLPPYHISDRRPLRQHNGYIMRHGSLAAIGILFFLAMSAVWISR